MNLTPLTPRDLDSVSALVRRVFDAHVASLYPPEGCAEFYRFIAPSVLAEGLGTNLRGFVSIDEDNEPVGVVVLKDSNHISLFFVETSRQRQGVGRRLFEQVAAEAVGQGLSELTVNASPNAVGAYVALGFLPTGPTEERNGITFVPMSAPLTAGPSVGGDEEPPDDHLPGPDALLISGYDDDARRDLRLFLSLVLDREPPLRPLSSESLDRTVEEVLRADETDAPLPAQRLPRVVLFSGCTLSQARRVLTQWKASGLPRPIFSVATDTNLQFTVRALLSHLLEEHRAQKS